MHARRICVSQVPQEWYGYTRTGSRSSVVLRSRDQRMHMLTPSTLHVRLSRLRTGKRLVCVCRHVLTIARVRQHEAVLHQQLLAPVSCIMKLIPRLCNIKWPGKLFVDVCKAQPVSPLKLRYVHLTVCCHARHTHAFHNDGGPLTPAAALAGVRVRDSDDISERGG